MQAIGFKTDIVIENIEFFYLFVCKQKPGAPVSDLCQAMSNVSITSLYVPEAMDPGSSELSSSDDRGRSANLAIRRVKLNEFLTACDRPILTVQEKPWSQLTSSRAKRQYIGTATDTIVSTMGIISPEDSGRLWEALLNSGEVEKSVGLSSSVSSGEDKYLTSLAEAYRCASTWDTRRQIMSVMADLVPYTVTQRYLPNITEYRVKTARQHAIMFGRGTAVTISKSPRKRVNEEQLGHFLTFITSPHVIHDLPFGEKTLVLADGTIVEMPNVIRTLVPERIVAQYKQYYGEIEFTSLSRSTMLRILSSSSANVRRSLYGLDYIAADRGKAFDKLIAMLPKVSSDCTWVQRWRRALMEAKQCIKSDYKVT